MEENLGLLIKNQSGRWQLGEVALTSGDWFEVYIKDHWIRVVIEHDGRNYFALPYCVRLHTGLRARWLGEYTD